MRADVDAAVKAANATLAVHARIAAWRFWPDTDFPRTHTLKVKRDQVRAWAAVAAPLPVTEASVTESDQGQPGGQSKARPPMRCRCRCGTDWPPQAPTFVVTR